MLYNSRDKNYKTEYGAIATGSEFEFRLLLPSERLGAETESACLVIYSDRDRAILHRYYFETTNEYKDDSRFWKLSYIAKEPGLYWYNFEYTVCSKTYRVYKGEYSTGYVNIPENRWQLTVYDGTQIVDSKWKGGIMYQIFPDRFYNSGVKKIVPLDRNLKRWGEMPSYVIDPLFGVWNNDYQCGDLKGIEEKLPYIKSLNVDMIYLNPIFEAHSNHRYNTANYEAVDPLLGKEEDFISLCMEAHKLGIKVILDGVFSHTGDDSVYFNRYKRYDNDGAYNSKSSPYYKWYKFENWPSSYDSWWGIDSLPEVDEINPSYTEFITGKNGVIAKWMRLGADGFRLDVADELPDEFIVKIRERIKSEKPDALLLGEVWEDASTKTAYGIRREYLLGKELDSVMNYPFKEAIIDYIVNDNAEDFMDRILTITENYPKEIVDTLMNPLSTHDTVRILSRLSGEDAEGPGKDREWQSKFSLSTQQRERCKRLLKIATAIQYTLPGFPSVYYGDEIGMEGLKDPFNRKAFPWGHMDMELLGFFEKLGEIRANNHMLKDAEFVPISGADGCIAYAREKDGNPKHSIILIANRAPDAIDYRLPDHVTNPIKLIGDGEIRENTVHLPAESFILLENVKVYLKDQL